MFSIENLLSNKYTAKSSQNAKSRDQVESISTITQISRKIGGGGLTEVNSFAGKRETLYLELSAANERPSTEGADGGRDTETVSMTLQSPPSKVTLLTSPGKVEGRSRKRHSDARGEEDCGSESDSDERDSESEEGMIFG